MHAGIIMESWMQLCRVKIFQKVVSTFTGDLEICNVRRRQLQLMNKTCTTVCVPWLYLLVGMQARRGHNEVMNRGCIFLWVCKQEGDTVRL